MQINSDSISEAQFHLLFEQECQRKDKLLTEFEKLEQRERRRKNPKKPILHRKYERVTQGMFFVEKKNGDFIGLVSESGKNLGYLHVNPEISKLLRVNDCLEGTFAFRDNYWRVQFLFCITSSTEDFLP